MHLVVDDHAGNGGGDGGVVEVDVDPAQPGELAAAHAGGGDQQPQGVQAVVADMVSVVGTTGTGFLQNDPVWRALEQLPPGELASPFYLRLEVEDRAGVLAHVALRLASHGVSIARLVQKQDDGSATLHIITHEAPSGDLDAALEEIAELEESKSAPSALPVISDRGVPGLGWA